MIISFNRRTGFITSLTQCLDNFTDGTIEITEDVSFSKLKETATTKYVNTLNNDGLVSYQYGSQITSMISQYTSVNKGSIISGLPFPVYSSVNESVNKLEPIVDTPQISSNTYVFPDDYSMFTIDEVINEYYTNILNSTTCDYLIGSDFSDLSDVNTNLSTYSVLEKRYVVLAPGDVLYITNYTAKPSTGVNYFKLLYLSNSDLDVYVNGNSLSEPYISSSPIKNINITISNHTSDNQLISNFAVGYSYNQGGVSS